MTGLQELPTNPGPLESGASEEASGLLLACNVEAHSGSVVPRRLRCQAAVLRRSSNLFLCLLFLYVPSSFLAPELVVQVWQVVQMAWYFIGPIKPVSKRCLFSDINTD